MPGVDSMPGTAAEVLDDQVKAHPLSEKVTQQLGKLASTAHQLGFGNN